MATVEALISTEGVLQCEEIIIECSWQTDYLLLSNSFKL